MWSWLGLGLAFLLIVYSVSWMLNEDNDDDFDPFGDDEEEED